MTSVLRMILLAASLLGATTSAGTFDIDEDTAYVLHMRRLFPDLLRDAAYKKNLNLPLIAHRRRTLRRELGPPRPRRYQTIRVELRSGQKIVKQVVPQSLNDLRFALDRVRRVHGGPLGEARGRTLLHVRRLIDNLLHGGDELFTDYDAEIMEEDLVDMLRFAIWSRDKIHEDDPFASFGEADLNLFLDRETFKERFGALRAELGVSRRKNVDVGRVLARLRDRTARVVRVVKTREVTTSRILSLVEVHPDLGLLKGLFAEDCSSHECMGYPLAPEDRVFLAVDEHADVRGGVVVSRVESEGRPALYLNTLSGAHLANDEFVTMILVGLRKLLEPGQKLLLPTAAVLKNNFNFSGIKAPLQQLVALTKPRPIRFYDEAERRLIEQYSFRSYDAVESHAVAHALPEDSLRHLEIDALVVEGSPWAEVSSEEPITEREFLDAMIELVESDRLDMAREFWTGAGRSLDEGQHVIDVLTNTMGATREGWVTRTRHMLERQGFAADQIERIVDDPERFELARLVAPDANAVSLWPRYLGHHHVQSSFPAFRRWMSELDGRKREELLHSTLAAMQSYADAVTKEERAERWVGSHLLVRLIDLKTLNERATELRAQHYPWPVLVRAAESLAGIGKDETLTLPTEAGMNMISIAFRSARTAEEYTDVYRQLRGGAVNTVLVQRAFGNTLSHFVKLEPTAAQIDFFGSEFEAPELVRSLVAWTRGPKAQQADEFLAAVEGLGDLEPGSHRPLVEAAVHARLQEFRNTIPLVADIGRLRRLAYDSESQPEKQLLDYAIYWVHRFDELYELQRGDHDEVLLDLVKHHLDLLANVFQATPLASCGSASHPFNVLARRHVALMTARSTAEFFGRLHDHPLPTRDASRKLRYGRLNADEIDRFVALGPSIEQFRRLMVTAGEYRGYARRLAPLVRDLPTLERAVAPLRTLDADDASAIRYEFAALLAAIASRPGERNFLTELALDRLMSRAGLGAHRHEIPSLPGRMLDRFECEEGLIEVKAESSGSP